MGRDQWLPGVEVCDVDFFQGASVQVRDCIAYGSEVVVLISELPCLAESTTVLFRAIIIVEV